jgi:hypothetical protein
MPSKFSFVYDLGTKLFDGQTKKVILKRAPRITLRFELDGELVDELNKSKDADFAVTKIHEKATKVCEEGKQRLIEKINKLEPTLSGMQTKEFKDACQKYREELQKDIDALKVKVQEVPRQKWESFQKKFADKKKAFKKFKIDVATEVSIGVMGVAASSGAVAASAHTGGASLVLGAIGLARSVVKIVLPMEALFRDVLKQAEELKKDVEKMQAEFASDKKKAEATGKDLALSVANTILGPGYFTTVSTVSKKAKLLDGAVAGAYVASVKKWRKVAEIKGEIGRCKNTIDRTGTAKHVPGDPSRTLKEVKGRLTFLEGELPRVEEKAKKLSEKAKAASKTTKSFASALETLKQDTKTLKIIEEAMKLVAELGFAAASAGVGLSHEGLESVQIVAKSVHLAQDVFETTHDIVS